MNIPKIFESEYRFCCILWDNEPVTSSELVRLCAEKLGWKTVSCVSDGAMRTIEDIHQQILEIVG